MANQINIDKCTSCGSDQIVVAGNKFLCRPCNVVYEVTDTGTKVLDANPLDQHEQRLGQAELAIKKLEGQQQGGAETVEAPDPHGGGPIDRPVETETEEDIEEDGFITWK